MNERKSIRWILLAFAILAPSALLMVPYSLRMWNSGHYQYFPLVFGAAAVGIGRHWKQIVSFASPAKTWVFLFSIAFVLTVALLGNLLNSGLIGVISVILGVFTLIYGMVGWGGLRQAAPYLMLLLFAIPLPLSLDQKFIFEMQVFSSRLSSWLLDGFGFVHFREGVVLMTEKSRYLTEEACSGVRSLFSSLAVVAMVSVSLQHSLRRILCNLLQTIVWVIVGNAIRVASVVYIADTHTDWVVKDFGHEIVGYLVFLFILVMVASTDALIRLSIRYYFFRTLEEEPNPDDSNELEFGASTRANALNLRWTLMIGLSVFSGIIFVISTRVAYVQTIGSDRTIGLKGPLQMMAADEQEMPRLVQGWSLKKFEHVHRERGYFQADNSFIWTYTKGSLTAYISLDGPWGDWHDLSQCYRGLGWDINSDYFLAIEGDYGLQKTKNVRHSELNMKRNYDVGFVAFSSVDRNGAEMLPGLSGIKSRIDDFYVKQLFKSFAETLGLGTGVSQAISGNQLPATTIQVFAATDTEWQPDDIQEVRALFFSARELLVNAQRFQKSSN